MQICKCVFVENSPLHCYYAVSSVKNTRRLVTLNSVVIIYFAVEASNRAFVGLSCECITVSVSLWRCHCECVTVSVPPRVCHCECATVSVPLWVCHCVSVTVYNARISNNENYKSYTCQRKILDSKEISKNILSYTNDINFSDWRNNKCNLRASVSPFSCRM